MAMQTLPDMVPTVPDDGFGTVRFRRFWQWCGRETGMSSFSTDYSIESRIADLTALHADLTAVIASGPWSPAYATAVEDVLSDLETVMRRRPAARIDAMNARTPAIPGEGEAQAAMERSLQSKLDEIKRILGMS